MKEKLMAIHTTIYLIYIISDFISTGTQLLSKVKHSDGDYLTSCRLQIVQRIANDVLWFICSAMVLLQSYMCTKFSVPVNDSQ